MKHRMKADRVLAIAGREIAAIRRSRALWMPMAALPAIIFVAFPLGAALVPQLVDAKAMAKEAEDLFAALPPSFLERLPLDQPAVAFVEFFLRQALAPLFVLVPVMVASLVAAAAFAGERERGTLEPILHSPVTDAELFTGKVLGAVAPAWATCALGLVVVSVVADIAAWPLVGRPLLPDALWLVTTLVLAPAVAALAVIFTVFVSARVRGFQEANQLSALLVLPIVGLVVGQVSGLMLLSAPIVLAVGLALLALDGVLVWVLGRSFGREALFRKT